MTKIIKIFVLLILITCNIATSQSLEVSTSVVFKDGINTFVTISANCDKLGLHYFHSTESRTFNDYIGKSKSNLGISYKPINLFDIVHIGGLVTIRNFPTSKATRFNFMVEAGKTLNNIRFSVVHVSNGFGILHKINPGYHAISIRYYL